MTVAIQGSRERARAVALVRRVNFAVVVFLALYVAVGLLQPNYLEPAGAMNFLRRAAPLAILASGQLFVLTSGGFDLSVGSLITLTVIGGSMLTANDPSKTWSTIAVLYGIGLIVGLINGAVVAYLKTPSIIATLGTLLSVNGAAMMWSGGSPRGYLPDNFRMFGRFVFHDVPVIGVFRSPSPFSWRSVRSRNGGCMERYSGAGCSRSATILARPNSPASGSNSCASASSSFPRSPRSPPA